MKKLLNILIGILLGGILMFCYIKYFPTTPKTPKVSAIDFEGKINEIGELSTAEYVYSITQVADKDKLTVLGIKIPFTESKIIYGYSGTIKAGVDFTQIKITADESSKEIKVKMPDARILSNELDQDSLIIYDERNSIFNQFSFEDMNASQAELKATAETAAIERDILGIAKENAKTIIEKTIRGLFEDGEYRIVFE